MHLLNPDATLWGATAIAIEAGFMLAACYAATRNLWVPIGLHFGWNFAAGRHLRGAVVSGNGESEGAAGRHDRPARRCSPAATSGRREACTRWGPACC